MIKALRIRRGYRTNEAAIWVVKVNINLEVMSDEKMFLRLCKPHDYEMLVHDFVKDFIYDTRVCNLEELEVMDRAFETLYNAACAYFTERQSLYMSRGAYDKAIGAFNTIFNFCAGEEII